VSARRSYAFSANDKQEVNDPKPLKEVPNVSKTNELPIESPHKSEALQESVEDAEHRRIMQAPNRATVWSRHQNPRGKAMTGPRFEQTIMDYQVGRHMELKFW
jgi:NADH dehydrogenase (ubiquinone) Fe-S protein 6